MSETYRYLLRYKKYGGMRYIGHIDFIRVMQRAVNRAGLPVEYSAGFNPHQRMSLAFPLPVGMSGFSEYAEIYLRSNIGCDEVKDGLSSCLPDGAEITACRLFAGNEKTPAAALAAAEYTAEISGAADMGRHTELILDSIRDTEIANRIISLKIIGANKISMVVKQGNTNNLKPDAVVSALYEVMQTDYDPANAVYTRMELFKEKNGAYVPIYEI